jgi:serine phosphatase RsbU (regulator of sigma subunit)
MGLKLPHEHNSPTFRFIGVTMHQPWKVKYKYILEGYDDDWSTLTAENFIHYGNLPAGDYNFKVMSMSSSGYWSEPVQFSFTIVPPWWRNWWSFTGYILIGFFSVFSYIRWRERALKIQQKKLQIRIDQATRVIMDQKTEVENQKALVEEQNREILDSIEYAKRIQAAILPPPAEVKEMLKDSFVVYMPKDIVAGDFYWMDSLGEEIYFAACDCTGHGVPGAMVSVVCNYVLNASINEFSIRDPGAIFDKARELLIANFAKSDEDVKDGMDASLCALNISERKLKWCGANNPIWIYRSDEKVMEEIKPDKQPIGKGYEMKPFTTHQLDLKAGDVIYIFTDGYADQFGGEKNKKLTRSRFRDLLLRIAELPMVVQREKLISFHHEYRGKQEQVDDICVIGVRV